MDFFFLFCIQFHILSFLNKELRHLHESCEQEVFVWTPEFFLHVSLLGSYLGSVCSAGLQYGDEFDNECGRDGTSGVQVGAGVWLSLTKILCGLHHYNWIPEAEVFLCVLFICCFVISVVPDKDFLPKYWVVLVFHDSVLLLIFFFSQPILPFSHLSAEVYGSLLQTSNSFRNETSL